MIRSILLVIVLGVCPHLIGAQHSNSILANKVKESMVEALLEHREIVSIPNDSNYPDDMDKNVNWIKEAFEKRGFVVNVIETPTIPVILTESLIDQSLPTVLFYIHYDGQPVDPSKWDQEHPFTPVIKEHDGQGTKVISYDNLSNWNPEWRVYARASADDKGPLMMFLKALDIMKSSGIKQAYNIKLVLDGEEERGSSGLKYALKENIDLFEADRMIIMDGPAHPTNLPTLTFGCRGAVSAVLTIYGPRTPQHSGHFGNYAPNPAFLAANLLASMKNEEGRVLIEKFYDDVDLSPEDKDILNKVPDDEDVLKRRIGIAEIDDVGKNYQEALQYPSLNIRGMASGWVGKQTRTIIPDKVVIQLGIRLVVETDGNKMLDLVENHIKEQGFYVIDREPNEEERLQHPKIASFVRGTPTNAFRTDINSPIGKWLSSAISKLFLREPVKIRTMGGTVPITPMIQSLNIPAVIVPLVNMDNNQHSPNENLRVGNLYNGILACIGIFTEPIE